MLKVAIVGSGPAGCYAADRLSRLSKEHPLQVDVLDKLPTPYGLVRAGVAPDHQSTKQVSRVMARVLSKDPVRFFGNVELGETISLDELQDLYDVVILAVGAPKDRSLGIPGEDLPGMIDFLDSLPTEPVNRQPTAEAKDPVKSVSDDQPQRGPLGI